MHAARVYEYCYLYQVAKKNLELAEKEVEGSFYPLITCLGFCAFLLESVMNEIGVALFADYWMSDHKKASPKKKRNLIHARLGILCANGRHPFQTFHEVFRVRNLLVHAKPQKLDGSVHVATSGLAGQCGIPISELQHTATAENVRRIFNDTEAMIGEWARALPPNTHAGLQCVGGPFRIAGHTPVTPDEPPFDSADAQSQMLSAETDL